MIGLVSKTMGIMMNERKVYSITAKSWDKNIQYKCLQAAMQSHGEQQHQNPRK
jgi:hypothetical protein